jgi:hypothetical protein
MGQDPVRHGHPDPAQRLLRAARAEELPACKRMLHLPGLPVRSGVPARTARATPPHAHLDRDLHQQGPSPHGGDEPAGPHQPGPHDRRDREGRRKRGRRCGLATPATSSPPPGDEPSRHANAPSPRCGAWTPPASGSASTPSPAQPDVSRSWLYTQDDLRAEIERLRHRHPAASPAPPPRRQRASDPSLLRRLEAATSRIRQLEADNQQLRDALARALGQRRTADVLGHSGDRDTPRRNSPKIIRPC